MSDLLDGLRTAQDLARHIGQHPSINHQQALFLQHIERTAQRLYDLLAPIPNTHLAYLSLVPRMADELQEPLAVIYGYARMMLDQPTSFGDAYLPLEMQTHAETLYELGRALSQDLHNLTKDAFEARLQTRRAPAENIDLAELLNDYAPIWHYEMQMHDVDLNFHTEVRPLCIPMPTICQSGYVMFCSLSRKKLSQNPMSCKSCCTKCPITAYN
jgi:signal transduction histidine kinase